MDCIKKHHNFPIFDLDACIQALIQSNNLTVGPLHGGESMEERLFNAYFLFGKTLESYQDSYSLGPISLGFLKNMNAKSPEFVSVSKWIRKYSAQITKNVVNGENSYKGVAAKPRLSGKGATFIVKNPNCLAEGLIKAVAQYKYNNESRRFHGIRC